MKKFPHPPGCQPLRLVRVKAEDEQDMTGAVANGYLYREFHEQY